MKRIFLFAALLAVLFLVPIFSAGATKEAAAFAIDQRAVLTGMGRSWLQGYAPEITRNLLSLVLPIVSPVAQGAIQGEVLLQDETLSPFPLQAMTATAQQTREGLWALRFSLNLHKDRQNGDYPALLRITGTDAQGNPLQTDIPYVFRIRDGQPNTEAIRIQLTEVQAAFRLGEDASLTATLENPCKSIAFEQISLRITDSSEDILPAGAGTLYLDGLAPGERVQVSFPMTVLPTASVSSHMLNFSLEWTALGKQVTQSENFTFPVVQDIRLEQGGLKMPASVVAGDSATLSLPLMNMGKGNVVQVLATLTLPGIVERQSVLVGSIAPGETKNAQMTIVTDKNCTGSFDGTLSVACSDQDGNAFSFSIPVSLAVETPPPALASALEQEQQEPSRMLELLGGGCGVLLLFCIVQGTMLRRKIRRLEEDRL